LGIFPRFPPPPPQGTTAPSGPRSHRYRLYNHSQHTALWKSDKTQYSRQADIHALAGFEPAISANKRLQTQHALDRAASGVGFLMVWATILPSKSHYCFLDYDMAKDATFNLLKPSGILLKISTLSPTQCIYVFSMHLRTNSDYFLLYSSNWLAFTIDTESVYCAVRTGYLNLLIRFNLCLLWLNTDEHAQA